MTAVRAWGAARRVGGMDRDVDKPGEASNRPSPFLNSLKHEPTTRFHKSLIGLCRSRSCDSCRAPADAARRPKRRVRALVGHDRQLQSRLVDHGRYSSSRAYGAPAATHLLKELPRGKHLAVSQEHAQGRATNRCAHSFGDQRSKVSAAALRSYCDAPSSCAYGAPAATQRSISLSLMQLLLRLPCVARRLGALEICTSTRTMR